MKFHVTTPAGQNVFTGYGDGYVAINNERYEHPVLVSPQGEIEPWDAASFEALTREHFEALLARGPELVLLGTGDTLRFPRPELTRALAGAGTGFEAMDTKAACRTFNILMAEGRKVIAAILV